MEQIKNNWNQIHRLSKVTLKEDLVYTGFEGKTILKKGVYFISGFWANAMGLSDSLKSARKINNKWVLPSVCLKEFYK